MRLFVAVGIPESVRGAASEILEGLKSQQIKANFVSPESLHVTLLFLGENSESELRVLKRKLASVSSPCSEARLTCTGVFPSWNHIRVAWLGLAGGGWKPLHKAVSEALSKQSGPEFVPHLTLARIRGIADKPRFVEQFKSLKVPKLAFPVEEFLLMASELTPEGPAYKKLATFRLA